MEDYVISKIVAKNGDLRAIHKEALGQRAYILDLEVGKRGWLKYHPRWEIAGNYHTLHTSSVLGYTPWESGEPHVEIETENSIYELDKVG